MSELIKVLDECSKFSPDIRQHYGRIKQSHNTDMSELKEENEKLKVMIKNMKELPIAEDNIRIIKENEKLRNLLRKFCTKSNGVSIFARSDIRSVAKAKENIMNMYEFQCEVEKYLKEIRGQNGK